MSFKANVKTHDNRYFHMREQFGLLWAGQEGTNAYMLDPGQALQIASLLRGWAEHAIAHTTTQAIHGQEPRVDDGGG